MSKNTTTKTAGKLTANQAYKLAKQQMKALKKVSMAKERTKRVVAQKGIRGAMKGVAETATAIVAPIETRKISEAQARVEMNKSNAKSYEQALNTWLDQMNGTPSTNTTEGEGGTKQGGSTTGSVLGG